MASSSEMKPNHTMRVREGLQSTQLWYSIEFAYYACLYKNIKNQVSSF